MGSDFYLWMKVTVSAAWDPGLGLVFMVSIVLTSVQN